MCLFHFSVIMSYKITATKNLQVRFCLFTQTPVFKPVYILVKNYAHKRGYLTCLLYQGFYKLKSVIIYFGWSSKWTAFFNKKSFTILLAVYVIPLVCLSFCGYFNSVTFPHVASIILEVVILTHEGFLHLIIWRYSFLKALFMRP